MTDETESIHRERLAEINAQPGSREALESRYGRVWTTDELSKDFEVLEFAAPLVVVRRKSDAKKGSLEFQSSPRFYFNWKPASPSFLLLPSIMRANMKIQGLPAHFWVVTTPTPLSGLGDICFRCDFAQFALQVRGGLNVNEIVGIYADQQTATQDAEHLLKAMQVAKGESDEDGVIHPSPWPEWFATQDSAHRSIPLRQGHGREDQGRTAEGLGPQLGMEHYRGRHRHLHEADDGLDDRPQMSVDLPTGTSKTRSSTAQRFFAASPFWP